MRASEPEQQRATADAGASARHASRRVARTHREGAPTRLCLLHRRTERGRQATRRARTEQSDGVVHGHPQPNTKGRRQKGSDRRFRWSEALPSTGWQMKDSNLLSSRDGFTVPTMRFADQRQPITDRDFPADSPHALGHSRGPPTSPDESPEPHEALWSPLWPVVLYRIWRCA